MKNISRDTVKFDMSYEEFKDLGRKAWKDRDNSYHYIDRYEKKNEIEHNVRNEIKNVFIECIPGANHF